MIPAPLLASRCTVRGSGEHLHMHACSYPPTHTQCPTNRKMQICQGSQIVSTWSVPLGGSGWGVPFSSPGRCKGVAGCWFILPRGPLFSVLHIGTWVGSTPSPQPPILSLYLGTLARAERGVCIHTTTAPTSRRQSVRLSDWKWCRGFS